jgi:hypothetical protein
MEIALLDYRHNSIPNTQVTLIKSKHIWPNDNYFLIKESEMPKDRQCMYKHKIEVCLQKNCHWKAISITYSECVSVALVIQQATHMRHIILTSVACPVLPYFSMLSQVFRGKKILTYKMCVFIFHTIFVCNISHFKMNSVI